MKRSGLGNKNIWWLWNIWWTTLKRQLCKFLCMHRDADYERALQNAGRNSGRLCACRDVHCAAAAEHDRHRLCHLRLCRQPSRLLHGSLLEGHLCQPGMPTEVNALLLAATGVLQFIQHPRLYPGTYVRKTGSPGDICALNAGWSLEQPDSAERALTAERHPRRADRG